MNETLEKLYDATVRIERIIYLAGAMAATDAFSDDLNDFLDEEDDVITKCLGGIPEWVDLTARNSERADWVWEWLRGAGKFGFLVRFATPVMKPVSKGARSYSWGYYNTEWVYAESVDEAVEKGLAWAEVMRADEDAKSGASA